MSRPSPLPGLLEMARARLARLEKRQAEGLWVSPEAFLNAKALVKHIEARLEQSQGAQQ